MLAVYLENADLTKVEFARVPSDPTCFYPIFLLPTHTPMASSKSTVFLTHCTGVCIAPQETRIAAFLTLAATHRENLSLQYTYCIHSLTTLQLYTVFRRLNWALISPNLEALLGLQVGEEGMFCCISNSCEI